MSGQNQSNRSLYEGLSAFCPVTGSPNFRHTSFREQDTGLFGYIPPMLRYLPRNHPGLSSHTVHPDIRESIPVPWKSDCLGTIPGHCSEGSSCGNTIPEGIPFLRAMLIILMKYFRWWRFFSAEIIQSSAGAGGFCLNWTNTGQILSWMNMVRCELKCNLSGTTDFWSSGTDNSGPVCCLMWAKTDSENGPNPTVKTDQAQWWKGAI